MGYFGKSWSATIAKKINRIQPWPEKALSVPLLQSHRGFRPQSGIIENTIQAFELAQAQGFEMIELDVRLSKDNIPVVFHDKDLNRVYSQSMTLSDLEFSQIKSLTGIHRLEEILSSKKVPSYLNIELKTENWFEDAIERKVYELLIKHNALHRVLISSFNPVSLWRMSLYTKEIPLALLIGQKMDHVLLDQGLTLPLWPIHLLHLESTLIDDQAIQFCRELGVPFVAWTVNNLLQAKDLLSKGSLSVITDEITPMQLSSLHPLS